MRMKELVAESGVPRTAIHHYQREGLLPPVTKTAPNAAVYGEEHVRRLQLIRSLRSEELGPLSIDEVRQVLRLVDRGVEPAVAATLQRLPGQIGAPSGKRAAKGERSLSDVARDAGTSLSAARSWHETGLLPGRPGGPGDGPAFDEADVVAARLIHDLLAHEGVRATDLDPIAELVGELVRYEQAFVTLATAGAPDSAALERRAGLHQGLLALHTYLFSRLAVPSAS
jgi:DNA-binding transcriptional MerR regulator